METTSPLLINAKQAGRLIGMIPARVTRLANRRELPVVILPDGELRFSPDDLAEWVKSHRQQVEEATQ